MSVSELAPVGGRRQGQGRAGRAGSPAGSGGLAAEPSVRQRRLGRERLQPRCHGYTEARSDAVIFSPAVPIYWWRPGDTQERQEGFKSGFLPETDRCPKAWWMPRPWAATPGGRYSRGERLGWHPLLVLHRLLWAALPGEMRPEGILVRLGRGTLLGPIVGQDLEGPPDRAEG